MSKNLNEDFIRKLFSDYRQMMYKVAYDILHNSSDSEDAVQDAFLWIINNIEKISEIPCNARAHYFASIIEHRSIDICRKRKARSTENIEEQHDLNSNEDLEKTVMSEMTVDEIKSAMNELSNIDYEMLYLYLFQKMRPKEISKATGISELNIRVYIYRAKQRLIKILKKRGITYDI